MENFELCRAVGYPPDEESRQTVKWLMDNIEELQSQVDSRMESQRQADILKRQIKDMEAELENAQWAAEHNKKLYDELKSKTDSDLQKRVDILEAQVNELKLEMHSYSSKPKDRYVLLKSRKALEDDIAKWTDHDKSIPLPSKLVYATYEMVIAWLNVQSSITKQEYSDKLQHVIERRDKLSEENSELRCERDALKRRVAELEVKLFNLKEKTDETKNEEG